jgi:hypothetical protein
MEDNEPSSTVKLHLIVTKPRAMRHSICGLLRIDFAYREGDWRGYLQTLTLLVGLLTLRPENDYF